MSEPTPVDTTGTDATAPITIELSIELDLSPDEVWPDGDIPKGWTPKDVMKVIQDCGTAERFIKDWDLTTFGASVSVHARGTFEHGNLR